MIDALWIAASGVSYATSMGDRFEEVALDYFVDRHPCDDLPYVANISIQEVRPIDGPAKAEGDSLA